MTTMQVIDPRELNDLAEFAARGGLGSTVASVILFLLSMPLVVAFGHWAAPD